MRIHILSDLHTEFSAFDPPETDANVVVLAGDIGVGTGGIEWAARRFPDVPVIYVPGNHEFYGHDVDDTNQLIAAAPANVQVLSDDFCEMDGARFLGSTLWTDFKLYGEAEAWYARQRAKTSIADLYRNDPLNPAFASRLEGVIEKYQPELWIHGHTHVPCDYEIFGTRVLCNPRGYQSEPQEKFSPALIVEL